MTGFVKKMVGDVAGFFAIESTVCRMPGCKKKCYVENDGYVHDFCGRTHAKEFNDMKEAERQKKIVREKRLKAVQNPQTTGGAWGQGAQPHIYSYSMVAACGLGHNGSSHTRSGAPYGVHMVDQPPVGNQVGAAITPMSGGPIRFYNRDDPYYEFTNFYPAPVNLDGKTWPTTEHYFQAQKFIGTEFPEMIRNFERPREAFDLSRNPTVSCWCRKDWKDVKMDVMRKALLAKFTQHKCLRQMLLRTGDNMLIEHSPYDKFWGNGGDDTGENRLGMLLMEIRQILHDAQACPREEVTITIQPRVTPDTHRELYFQRSTSMEKDDVSSHSSSSMDCTDAGAEKADIEQKQQADCNHQEPQKETQNSLSRPPLHPVPHESDGSSTQQSVVDGNTETPGQASAMVTGTGPSQVQVAMRDPPVATLVNIEADEVAETLEPHEEDKNNPMMVGGVPRNLSTPMTPIQCTDQGEGHNGVFVEPPSSSAQPEAMDTTI